MPMVQEITKDNLFTRKSIREKKNFDTDNNVRTILETEAKIRDDKTTRLRNARLAHAELQADNLLLSKVAFPKKKR